MTEGKHDGLSEQTAGLLRGIASEFGAGIAASAGDPGVVAHLAGLLTDLIDVELADRGDLVFHPETMTIGALVTAVVEPARAAPDIEVTTTFTDASRAVEALEVVGSRDHLVRAIRTVWFGLDSPDVGAVECRAVPSDDRIALCASVSAPHAVGPLAVRASRAILAVHGAKLETDEDATTVSLPLAPWSGANLAAPD